MSITVTRKVHFSTGLAGQKRLRKGTATTIPAAHIPRISRLMALAIHFDQLIREGKVKDYAELARLGQVTRARVTQIMNLLNLHPKIQEQLLFCHCAQKYSADDKHQIRKLIANPSWTQQRIFVNAIQPFWDKK